MNIIHILYDFYRLHEEIEDFFQWMVPTPLEHEARIDVVGRVRTVIRKLWPQAKVDIFGSFKTGLYLPTSDIDLVICGKWSDLPLHTLHDELVKSGIPKPDESLVLDKAAVSNRNERILQCCVI